MSGGLAEYVVHLQAQDRYGHAVVLARGRPEAALVALRAAVWAFPGAWCVAGSVGGRRVWTTAEADAELGPDWRRGTLVTGGSGLGLTELIAGRSAAVRDGTLEARFPDRDVDAWRQRRVVRYRLTDLVARSARRAAELAAEAEAARCEAADEARAEARAERD